MRNLHQRAAEATKLGEHIAAIVTIWLVVFALSWIAVHGDDIRAHRLGLQSVEQLDRLEWSEVEARIEAARMNMQHDCDYQCFSRIQEVGEWE